MYNRASCDSNGKPWDAERRQVWWDDSQQKWVGNDIPDFKADSSPRDHMGPFIMNPEGVGRIFAPLAAFADGPFPEHYDAHIYETTAAQPGTFQGMVDGTVSEEWAWTHHPAWYEEVTGRDPREAYERARDRQAERRQVVEAWEREQETRDSAQSSQRRPASERNQM